MCAPFVNLTAPRFVDNGDGTVTDTLTRLIWEKKQNLDSTVNLADPHDADNSYSWSTGAPYKPTGTAYTDFLYALNGGTSLDGVATTGCFTGHCDWRLPTIEELQTILLAPYPCGTSPCIDPIFGPTQADFYWSATTRASTPNDAWDMFFLDGTVGSGNKTFDSYVRAVRGGL